MDALQAREASALSVMPGEPISSRVVDASFILLLAAMPLLAGGVGREGFALLAVVATGGAAVLYQRGSRGKRLSRCCWLIFLALAAAIYLAVRVLAPPDHVGGIQRLAAAGVHAAVCVGFVAWALKLARARRVPRLVDAYDWGAAITVGILVTAGGAFAALGDLRAMAALVMPGALVGMHFVVREQCRSLHKARRFVQIAVLSAIVSLIGWAVAV